MHPIRRGIQLIGGKGGEEKFKTTETGALLFAPGAQVVVF